MAPPSRDPRQDAYKRMTPSTHGVLGVIVDVADFQGDTPRPRVPSGEVVIRNTVPPRSAHPSGGRPNGDGVRRSSEAVIGAPTAHGDR